jgi:hypothetical protein
MEGGAVERAFEAIEAAVAALTAEVADSGARSTSEADPLSELMDSCLDILSGISKSEAQIAALKVEAAARYTETAASLASPMSAQDAAAREMAITAEVACVLTIGERAAGTLLAQAHALTTTLPLTLSALHAGSISWQHARAMLDEAACLDPVGAGALEAHFLDPEAPNPARGCPPGELPASRFRNKARTWRERHHAESMEKRHAKGVTDRRVEYTPDQDGMAWLSVYLPAATTNGIWNRTTAVARGLQGPDESRTLPQLRADVLAAALLSTGSGHGLKPGHVPPPRAQVLVTVPVFSLLGATDEPAMLDGYGPIPASVARGLVANGADSFYRVLVDPRDGAPLEIGRTSYRLTKAMRTWLRMRDGKCPFPGCSNHSLDNEADHLLAWHKGGTTGISNLGQPCPKHHRLKHASTWTPTPAARNEPPGWTSPSGRHYRSEQQDWEPPRWPRNLKPSLNLNVQNSPPLNLIGQRQRSTAAYAPRRHSYLGHTGETLGEESLQRFLRVDA